MSGFVAGQVHGAPAVLLDNNFDKVARGEPLPPCLNWIRSGEEDPDAPLWSTGAPVEDPTDTSTSSSTLPPAT